MQWLIWEALSQEPEDLNSISKTHIRCKDGTSSTKLLSDLHMCTVTCVLNHMRIQVILFKIFNTNLRAPTAKWPRGGRNKAARAAYPAVAGSCLHMPVARYSVSQRTGFSLGRLTHNVLSRTHTVTSAAAWSEPGSGPGCKKEPS